MSGGKPRAAWEVPTRPQGDTQLDIGTGQAEVRGEVPAARSPVPADLGSAVAPGGRPIPRDQTRLDIGPDTDGPMVQPGSDGRYAGARRVAGLLVRADKLGYFPLFEGSNRVGRDAGRDIVLDDKLVSGAQCTISVNSTTGRFSVTPAEGVRNPTLLDDVELDLACEIYPPARLKIGSTTFVVVRVTFE